MSPVRHRAAPGGEKQAARGKDPPLLCSLNRGGNGARLRASKSVTDGLTSCHVTAYAGRQLAPVRHHEDTSELPGSCRQGGARSGEGLARGFDSRPTC